MGDGRLAYSGGLQETKPHHPAMEVKLVARTLDLFDLFGREKRPLSLTELSRGLEVPMSSTLALVRTLAGKGYLYEIRRKGGYYPTGRMRDLCTAIDAYDPLLDLARPVLMALRDACGETVVLGKRAGVQVIYLDAMPALHAIHYTARAGELRPLQANSIGKALFSVLDPAEQEKLLEQIAWQSLTPRTLSSGPALLADAAQARARGWASNVGESVPDLAAVAIPFETMSEWYGLSIVGPLPRMQAHWDAHLQHLSEALARLRQVLAG